MPYFAVNDEKNRRLANKMTELGVKEDDLEEVFVRSSGNGGQKGFTLKPNSAHLLSLSPSHALDLHDRWLGR